MGQVMKHSNSFPTVLVVGCLWSCYTQLGLVLRILLLVAERLLLALASHSMKTKRKKDFLWSFSWDSYKLITQSPPKSSPTDEFTLTVKMSTSEFGTYALYYVACMVHVLFPLEFSFDFRKLGRFLVKFKTKKHIEYNIISDKHFCYLKSI